MKKYICLLLLLPLLGCGKKVDNEVDNDNVNLSVEKVILKYQDMPIGKAIEPICKKIMNLDVLIPTDGVSDVEKGQYKFLTGNDKYGDTWVYVYTNEAKFSECFPQGGNYVSMKFSDLYEIVIANNFGGIFVNSASKSSYPMPKEMFDEIGKIIRADN